MPIDYDALMRALRPTMTFEVSQENINASSIPSPPN